MSTHQAEISWRRQVEERFTDSKYSRAHEGNFDGGVIVPGQVDEPAAAFSLAITNVTGRSWAVLRLMPGPLTVIRNFEVQKGRKRPFAPDLPTHSRGPMIGQCCSVWAWRGEQRWLRDLPAAHSGPPARTTQ